MRYLKDEYDYIWSYCIKTGFDKHITPKYHKYFQNLILEFGFIDVQQAIKKIHKWNMKYPMTVLREELLKKNLDYNSLNKIPAYVASQEELYNQKMEKELDKYHEKMIIGKETEFRKIEVRKRVGKNSDGYWSFDEIEKALLGEIEIFEDNRK